MLIGCLRLTNVLILTLLLSACVTTPVSFPEHGTELKNLAALVQQPLYLKISAPESLAVGNQYVFFIIPFGQIRISSSRADIISAASEKLLLSGYRPIILDPGQVAYPLLELNHLRTSISAFDLLATRKISISIAIQARHFNKYGLLVREEQLKGQNVAYKRFAFSKQLDFYYQKALRSAFERLL